MASISESEFKERFRKKEKIMETEIPLKGVPFRAGEILHEDGKRYGFRTNIHKKKIKQQDKELEGFSLIRKLAGHIMRILKGWTA
jgi:hypothetical protein